MATRLPLFLCNFHSQTQTHLQHLYHPLLLTTVPSSSTKLPTSFSVLASSKMGGNEITEETSEKPEVSLNGKKKIFVAGATGSTAKRIDEQLLAIGFSVKAGVRDLDKAKTTFSKANPDLQIVKVDVTVGSAKLAEVIGDDSEAVICGTGFRPRGDLFAPWNVDNFGTVNLFKACWKQSVNRFILISSILVNGSCNGADTQSGLHLPERFRTHLGSQASGRAIYHEIWNKLQSNKAWRLRNEPSTGNVVMEPEDTLYEGTKSRDQVAEVAVEALGLPESQYKVVEIVACADALKHSYQDLFGSIKQQ